MKMRDLIKEALRQISPTEIIIEKGDVLFHGTVEPFDKSELRTGGYDNLFWTATDSVISQTYIPAATTRIHTSSDNIARPTKDPLVREIQKNLGIEYDYSQVEFVGNQARSYPLPPIFANHWGEYNAASDALRAVEKQITEYRTKSESPDLRNLDAVARRQFFKEWRQLEDQKKELQKKWFEVDPQRKKIKYVNEKLTALGYKPNGRNEADSNNNWTLKIDNDGLVSPDHKAKGRLFICTVLRDLKIYDNTYGGQIEGDLTDVEYHSHELFQKKQSEGYDGVRINDFLQSEHHGNVGHKSIGLFKHAIKFLDIDEIEAVHPDLEKHFDSRDWRSDEYINYLGKKGSINEQEDGFDLLVTQIQSEICSERKEFFNMDDVDIDIIRDMYNECKHKGYNVLYNLIYSYYFD
jgi:hypothetical protein